MYLYEDRYYSLQNVKDVNKMLLGFFFVFFFLEKYNFLSQRLMIEKNYATLYLLNFLWKKITIRLVYTCNSTLKARDIFLKIYLTWLTQLIIVKYHTVKNLLIRMFLFSWISGLNVYQALQHCSAYSANNY